jgi:non-homologous end joining protein Ku
MRIDIDIEDYTIILNALHYYKKVEKRGNFKQYDEERINALRDKIAQQLVPSSKIDFNL